MSTTKYKALEDVAEYVTVGYVGPSTEYFCDDGIPFLRTGNVGLRKIILSNLKKVIPEFHRKQKKSSLITGDVVITRVVSDEINAAVVPEELNGANCGNIIVVRPGINLNSEYLVHLLSSPDSQRVLMGRQVGSAQSVINTGVLKTWKIPVLPIEEQRRIASILDKADALRVKRREALAELDVLTQSIFIDMFGTPATNPKGWAYKSLFDLGKVVTGGTPPSAKPGMFDGPIPFVTPGDLESDEPVKRSLTAEGAEESRTVRAGATLVCCIGTIGKMDIARVRSAFNQQINAIEWSGEVDDLYGHAVLQFFRPTIKSWGASTTVPILKKSSFEKIEIPVPPPPLQREFADRVKAVEKLRVAHKTSLAELDELFASLQNRAFIGEL